MVDADRLRPFPSRSSPSGSANLASPSRIRTPTVSVVAWIGDVECDGDLAPSAVLTTVLGVQLT